MVSLIKAFLPGNRSSGASKLPRPNSAMHAMAFFFTAMCPPTISFTPCAMARKSPANFSLGMATSMSPLMCSSDIRLISAMNDFKLRAQLLDGVVNESFLAREAFQRRVEIAAGQIPRCRPLPFS